MSNSIQNYTWPLKPHPVHTWVGADNVFTKEECYKIIEIGKDLSRSTELHEGTTDNKNYGARSCLISFIRSDIKENMWLFDKLSEVVNSANDTCYGFDLTEIENLQFTEYRDTRQDFFKKHIDILGFRKLSFSIQLTDSAEYEGGDFLLHTSDTPIQLNRNIGSVNIFPSWALHEVLPVTKGTRHSLVGWVNGPRFK